LTKETSAGRRNRLGLIGSLLATPQHLLLGSGAKVAATVATVVATVASVATPAARHDLAGGLDWAARQIAAEIRPGPKRNPPRRESRASNDLGRIPSFVAAPRSWSPMPGRTSRFAAAGTPASAVGDRAGSADVTSPAPTPGPDSSGPAPPATPAASVSSVTASSSPTGASTAQSVGTDASQAGNPSGGADAKPPTPPESEADPDAPGGSASAAHGNSGAGKPSDLPDGAKAAQGGGEDASHEAGSGQGGGSLHSGTAEAGDETDQPDDATDQTDDANGQADTLDPDTVDRQPPGNVDSAGNGGDHTADGSGRGTKGLADSTDNSTR